MLVSSEGRVEKMDLLRVRAFQAIQEAEEFSGVGSSTGGAGGI